jgi:hypothetical protein
MFSEMLSNVSLPQSIDEQRLTPTIVCMRAFAGSNMQASLPHQLCISAAVFNAYSSRPSLCYSKHTLVPWWSRVTPELSSLSYQLCTSAVFSARMHAFQRTPITHYLGVLVVRGHSRADQAKRRGQTVLHLCNDCAFRTSVTPFWLY